MAPTRYLFLLLCLSFCPVALLAQTETDTLRSPSGMPYVYLKKGEGKKAEKGRKVKVHYIARYTNGTIFETTFTDGYPMKFTLGDGSVVKGWEEMLQLMAAGDKVSVLVPANLGYGSKGVLHPDDKEAYIIPPDTPVIFEIELVEVK